MTPDLPTGVVLHALLRHVDDRGAFTELFRDEWNLQVLPVQWNVALSDAGVLRGVHVHVRHTDYLTIVSGEMVIGLHDLRPDTPTTGRSCVLGLGPAADMAGLVLPPGVAHGFLSMTPTTHVYAVSHYWSLDDELGCRWDDPELRISWPAADPLLSPRDEAAGSLEEMRREWLRLTRRDPGQRP